MRRTALLLPLILVLAAACSTTTPSPSSSPSATPIVPGSPSPSTTPDPTPSVSPSPVPSETPVPAPSDDPSAMTPEEAALMRLLRADVAVDCSPRRADLPEGALRGIECRPDDPLAARVGVYLFKTDIEAAHAYMTRMADAGVDVNAGDCGRDIPGEGAWVPGDGEGDYTDPGVFNWENSALMPERSGCFLDENGTANARVTCGFAYIGILGTGKDLSDLYDWTWRYPSGYEPGTPDAPGICVGADVIG